MKNRFGWLLFLLVGLSFQACIDQSFDEPPVIGEPVNVTANTTIKELKALHALGGLEAITSDLIVKGIVVADDQSGNFYRNFILQDETAGISVLLTLTDFYNFYPIGREIYISCKGLTLGDYEGVTQLGGYTYMENGELNLAPIANLDNHLIRGQRKDPIAPTVKTINTLTNGDISTLIKLENVNFATGDNNQTYADVVGRRSLNRILVDCSGNEIIVRSSGYADFASELTPDGKGSIVGVYSVFGTDKQLFIRDTRDVDMPDARCGGGGGGGGTGVCGDNGIFGPIGGGTAVSSLNEDFSSVANNSDAAIPGWTNVAMRGSRLWRGRLYTNENNTYLQATAFNDSNAEMETWMISPPITLTGSQSLNFRSAVSFYAHNGWEVLISTDYSGKNVCDATWTTLNCALAGSGNANFEWVPSGNVSLAAYTGKGYIAFKYTGSGTSGKTTTFIIDDVKVQ